MIGKPLVEECEEVRGESICWSETVDPDDGGGDNVNIGGEAFGSFPGVMVLLSDFGREVANGDGANGDALIEGMNECERSSPSSDSGVSGLETWVREGATSGADAGGVERAGAGACSSRDGNVELDWGLVLGSFGWMKRREEVVSGCFGG